MAEILVSGYYGFRNAGDEAILAGMIQSFRDLLPDATFTVISGTAAYTRKVHGVKAVSRGQAKEIWRAIGRADLIILGGGSLLQDVTSSKSLVYYLGITAMAKVHGKPVMFYAQGAGPVTKLLSKLMIPPIVNRVNLITVRDEETKVTLRNLRVGRPVTVTADSALALGPADRERGAALLSEVGVDLTRPLIGVSVRHWKAGEALWQPELAKALDLLAQATGAQVVLLPMQFPQDVRTGAAVLGQMKEEAVLVQRECLHDELQAMISRCHLLIGMRYHSLVFAAMNGVPLVGLSYDPKNDNFLRLIGEEAAGDTVTLDADTVVEAGLKALAGATAFRDRLRRRMAELTPLSRQNAELAVALLKQRGIR
jgi:polysaccharide pyruvyl transferase CsaB